MSTMLQISLGVVPAVLLVLVMTLVNRKMLVQRLIAMALMAAVSITCGAVYAVDRVETVTESKKDSKEMADMVYALLAVGEIDHAEEFLKQLMENAVYVPDYALCQARIHVLREEYTAAKMLYEKATDAGVKSADMTAEYEMVCSSIAPAGVDISMLQHNPNYMQQIEGADQLIQIAQDAKRQSVVLVNQSLQHITENVSKLITEGAQNVQKSEELYQRYLRDESLNVEEVDAIIAQLNRLEKKFPALMKQPILREARMKMQLAKSDFVGVAKSATDDTGYKELMVLTELYINGYITESNFSKSYGEENISAARAVREHLMKLYSNEYENESSSDRRAVKSYIESLKYTINHPALGKMQEDLKAYAQHYNAVDGSKIYMQLANLSYHQGNEIAADKYLSDSFRVVGNCEDADFTQPMFEVINAINNKEDTEALKKVSSLVNQIMENSMVIDMHQVVRDPNPEQEKPEEEEPKAGFDTYVSDYASQKRAAINIVSLDAKKFEEVVLEICVDGDLAYSAQELKKVLQIKDCGAEIKDFTVEEITYDQVNIILVCDVSGSMDGSPIQSLQETVKRFISDKTDKERIGLVTFSSRVKEVYGLDTSVEQLNEAVESLYASGGTAIYTAMCEAVTMLCADKDSLNVILLLSDGQDNYPGSNSQIMQDVCQPSVDRGTVIYPVGLGGDVDSEYLAQFANGTGGSYLYVNDDTTLNNTYEYLHSLLSTRYRITYKAVDTMTNDRQVRVSIVGDDLLYDLRKYSLGKEEEATQQKAMKDRYVTGLDTRVLLKSKESQVVNLIVSGFKEDDKVSVKLLGDLDYDLSHKRISDTQYELTIPSNIAVGVYDVQVNVNGSTVYLANELTIGIEESKTRFGSYTFTAYIKKSSEQTTTLSGNVCLNGWLYFDGQVTLRGDIEKDAMVIMEDWDGSQIIYSEDHATGLAKMLAKKGWTVHIPAFGRVELYDDDYLTSGTADYTVSPTILPIVYLSNLFVFNDTTVYLYPDAIKVEIVDLTTEFPFQEQLLKGAGAKDIFNFTKEESFTLTKDTIGLYFNLELKHNSDRDGDNNSVAAKAGNMPLGIGGEAAVTIDTINSNYYIKFLAKLNFIDAKGLGLALRWSESLVPTEVRFYCDIDLNTNISGVPVTFSDFELGIKDIDIKKSPFFWTYEGVTKISVAKVSAVMPGLDKYLGDASVASLADTTMTRNLGEFYLKMSTKVKLFDEIQIGAAEIECGKIPYTNSLLNMRDTEVFGMRAKVTKGLFWNSNNCDIEMSGSLELALTNKVLGATVSGECDVDVRWWIFKKSFDLNGSGFVGVYQDHSGDYIFTVRATGRSSKGQRGVNVTWSKKYGKDIDTKFY